MRMAAAASARGRGSRRDAGWLVYDASGRGQITSALQWFGESTFWTFWKNGYEALSALDDNDDGELRGAELRHLGIWRDANGNGRSERGEVRPLAHHGIEAVSCRFAPGDGIYTAAWSHAGVRFAKGRHPPDLRRHSPDGGERVGAGAALSSAWGRLGPVRRRTKSRTIRSLAIEHASISPQNTT